MTHYRVSQPPFSTRVRDGLLNKAYLGGAALSIALIALFYISLAYDYLLFHTLAETFSIVIACGVFMIAWNAHAFSENDYLLFIGIASLFIAGVDFLHTLSYSGMAIFKGYGKDLPTQLWIIARYLQAVSLAIAPFYMKRTLNVHLTLAAFLLITASLVAAAFAEVFPACFVEGIGLTVFKKSSEYLICAILVAAGYILYKKSALLDLRIYRLLMASIVITIFSELCFTLYTDVYGYFNSLGHLLKIIAFYLVYKAIIESGLRKPYSLLFRNLKASEEALRKALHEVKTLRGIVPICAACKKVRDDQGYWQQVEVYIRARTDADFSHSICPDCMRELYPEYMSSERDSASQRPG